MRKIKYKVDFSNREIIVKSAMQNDNISLEIEVLDNGEQVSLADSNIELLWVKPDNFPKKISENITLQNNKIIVNDVDAECTSISGICNFELTIKKSDKQISTFPLTLKVIQSVINNPSVENTVMKLLEDLIIASNNGENVLVAMDKWAEEHQDLENIADVLSSVKNSVKELSSQIDEKANEKDLQVQKARIDNIIALPSDATTNDARLEDICVGADGILYNTPGNAVRQQIVNVNNIISGFVEKYENIIYDYVNLDEITRTSASNIVFAFSGILPENNILKDENYYVYCKFNINSMSAEYKVSLNLVEYGTTNRHPIGSLKSITKNGEYIIEGNINFKAISNGRIQVQVIGKDATSTANFSTSAICTELFIIQSDNELKELCETSIMSKYLSNLKIDADSVMKIIENNKINESYLDNSVTEKLNSFTKTFENIIYTKYQDNILGEKVGTKTAFIKVFPNYISELSEKDYYVYLDVDAYCSGISNCTQSVYISCSNNYAKRPYCFSENGKIVSMDLNTSLKNFKLFGKINGTSLLTGTKCLGFIASNLGSITDENWTTVINVNKAFIFDGDNIDWNIFNLIVEQCCLNTHSASIVYSDISTKEDVEELKLSINENKTEIDNLKNKSKKYLFWGDSLQGAGGRLADLVSAETGLECHHMGCGGETSITIAGRQGAIPWMVQPNVTIPAEKTKVQIILKSSDGKTINPCILESQNWGVNPCMIAGIEGTLFCDRDNVTGNNDSNIYFTRLEEGDSITIDRPIAVQTYAMRKFRNSIPIIWMGTNKGFDDLDDLVSQHKRMIEYAGAIDKEYLILGVYNEHVRLPNREDYEKRMTKEFGRHFINIRKYIMDYGLEDANIIPTEEDLVITSSSPIAFYPSLLADLIHPNADGKKSIRNEVVRRLVELSNINN